MAKLVDRVPLLYTPGLTWVMVRELCGTDEEALSGQGTQSALDLVDRLLTSPGDCRSADLVAADRDRVLAAVYMRLYGPLIRSTLPCRACGKPFDLHFSLPELLEQLAREGAASGLEAGETGVYSLPDGQRFRLPTGADELAVVHLPETQAEAALLQRCLIPNLAGDASEEPSSPAVQEAMRRVAPLVDQDLDAHCPECGEVQPVHFDIQAYLFACLLSESKRLVREVHSLALAYHWSPGEILGLPRRERRALYELIAAQAQQAAEIRA